MRADIAALWEDVGVCKSRKTCSRLGVRTYWFEPNPGTLASWQREQRFSPGVDRRVLFVCESPTKHASGSPDFALPGAQIDGWRCWGGYNATVTDGFWRARTKYGLQNCWITNIVKCGAGPGLGKPVSEEVLNCSPFLRREIEILQPSVIALVGKGDTVKFFKQSIKSLSFVHPQPTVIPITHYSYARRPGGRGQMDQIWAPEFGAILNELRKRGQDDPVWLEE